MVLLHGFAAHARLNREGPGVVEAPLAARRRVFALDARGHGTSDRPHDEKLYGEELTAADVRRPADRPTGRPAVRYAPAARIRAVFRGPVPLDRIAVPTLVLAGDADPLAVHPEVLAGAIRGARVTVLTGDPLSVVREPGFAAAITEFLAAG